MGTDETQILNRQDAKTAMEMAANRGGVREIAV